MPGNVDERVVEMRIDNKQFESGARTTISTLGKLERALNIKGSSKAIDEMADSVSKFDASPMANSIDKVGDHFNILEIAGMRVIENLTDAIFNFATKTVKQLVFEMPEQGWNKYETKAEAVQSIMAATRDMVTGISEVDENGLAVSFESQEEQMAKVNELLEQMNWFTDETSYNFNDMAANVGKFLAAGTGLEDTFTAIMGIASWGGSAGAKPQEVSRAMYNISQAMSSGAMKAIDWKSVENAGMATLEFKQNAIDAAVAMGKLNEWTDIETESLVKYYEAGEDASMLDLDSDKLFDAKSFREGLASGWFDTDVMMEVFKRYGEFQDKLYAATEETGLEATDVLQLVDKLRKGDIDIEWDKYAHDASMGVAEFKKVIEELSDVQWEFSENGFRMGQEAKTWTDMIEATKDAVSSEWMKTFQYIFGDYLEAKEFWTKMTSEFWDIFAAGGALRNEILDSWYSSGGRKALFGLDKDNLGAFWNILNAIKSFVNPIQEALSEVFGTDTEENIAGIGKRLAELTKRFQEITSHMGLSEEAAKGLKNIFTVIFTGVKIALKGIGGVLAVAGKFAWVLGEVLDAVLSLANEEITWDMVQERIKNSLKGFLEEFSWVTAILDTAKQKVVSFTGSLAKVAYYLRVAAKAGPKFSIDAIFGNFSKFEQFLFRLGERFPFLANVFSYTGSYLEKLIDHFSNFSLTMPSFSGILEKVVYWFSQLKSAITGMDVNLNGVVGIFGHLKEVADVLFSALFGDPKQLKEKIGTFISTVFGGISEAINKIKFADILKAARVGLLAGFLGGFLDIVRSFHMVANEVKSIPEAITDTLGAVQDNLNAGRFIKIAVALGILAGSIYALSQVPAENFTRVVLGLSLLALVLQKLSKGINIFSGSNNTGDTITKGLKANIKLMPDLAATILALAVAMGVMANAVIQFKKNGIGTGKNGWADLLMPIGTLLITLAAVFGFLYLIKKYDLKDVGKSFGMLITIFAIIGRIGKLIKNTKDVPIGNLIVVLAGMAGIMVSLAFVLRFASGFKKFKDNQILHVAALMLGIGIFISAAAGSAAKLGKLKFGKLLQGMGSVIVLMAALGGLMVWMSKMDTSKAGNMLKIAGSLALMVLALNMLVIPLMALSALPFWSMMGALLGIAGILAMLTATLAILSKMGDSNSGAMLKIAAALALMSLGLALVLPSLIAFAAFLVGIAAVLNGKMLLKLTGLALIMVVLGAGLLVAGAGIALFGAGLLAVSVSALLFAVALLAIVSAIDKLGEALPNLMQGLISTGEMMTAENALNIIKGAIAFGLLALAIYGLGKAFGALFSNGDVAGKLSEFGGRLVSSLGRIISNIGTKIVDALPLILKIIGGAAVVIGLYAIGLIPKLTSWFVQAIVTLLESIHQSVRANKGALEHSIFGTVEVLLEILLDSGTWVITVIRGLIDTAVTGILEWLAEKVEGIPMFGKGLADSLRGIADELPSTEELMGQWQDQRQTNSEWLQQFVPPAEEIKDASQETIDAVGTGMLEGQSSVEGAIDSLKTTVAGSVDELKGSFSLDGQSVVSEFANGMDTNAGLPVAESETVGGNVLGVLDGLIPKANDSGSNFLAGWNNGLVDFWNNGTIQGNLSTITDGITNTLFSGLDEHSPSKISEEAGSFYIIGLANGISKNAKLPLDAVNETTDPMVEALKNAMMQVATITDDDFTISPKITPVVDMSNVNAAAGSMGSLLGGSYRSYIDGMNSRASGVSAATKASYDERRITSDSAIGEIRSMGDRLDALGERIANMQIVLDSGALVGATSSKIDSKLGQISARRARAN